MTRPFLTARWSDLILVNYRVPPALLAPHVPPGSRLDTPDGKPDLHLLSLVAFHFSRTRVWGLPLPTGEFFPELNLRFYVRRADLRATVFLKEYVPVPLVALGARLLYRQPYELATLAHQLRRGDQERRLLTRFRQGANHGQIRLRAADRPTVPPSDSEAHFLKEHNWGFDRDRRGRTFRYRVTHPFWATYPVEEVEVAFDPGALLGGAWRDHPWNTSIHSVLYAAGSDVALYPAEPLETGA